MSDCITPDRNHSALLTIDVQRDFTLHGAISQIDGTLQAIPYIQRLVQPYREKGYPIIHVVRLYSSDGSNVDLCRRQDIENGKKVTQAKTTPIANNTAIGLKKKGYENLIIDPANQKDVDQVINSGGTLTDKAEFSSSYYTKPNKSSQKKYSDQQK
jgi:Isochorismatase family